MTLHCSLYVNSVDLPSPSQANEVVFNRAVDEVAAAAQTLIHSLRTQSLPRNREAEAARAKARSQARFGDQSSAVP